MTSESNNGEPGGSAPSPGLSPGLSPGPASAGAREGAEPQPYVSGRPDEIDVDRGAFVGVMVGVAMFVLFQSMIVGAFQTNVIGGETPVWAPLMFAGITQGIYVFPSLMFFINRKCPKMATGFTVVAAIVFVGGLAALIFA